MRYTRFAKDFMVFIVRSLVMMVEMAVEDLIRKLRRVRRSTLVLLGLDAILTYLFWWNIETNWLMGRYGWVAFNVAFLALNLYNLYSKLKEVYYA